VVSFDEPELEAILDDLGALENEAALTGTEK
jgi:hypothetical protein